MQAVSKAMSSGDYNMLLAAIQQLHDTIQRICPTGPSTTNDDADPERQVVSEEMILEQFGTSLQ